jgi:tetratricopeptide (TPR) repeat protein
MHAPPLPALGDRYRITRELGRGPAATVFHAEDRVLGRDVAIKLLTRDASEAVGVAEFENAVRVMSRMIHPNIVPLFDSGVADGCFYYVRPFVGGETLRVRIDREGLISPDEAVGVIGDVGEALAYAHGMRVVHGDIKPENIFCYHGRALIADFGMAGLLESVTPSAGSEGTSDARSDIFALGCVTYEMLTGEPPFAGQKGVTIISDAPASGVPRVRNKVPTTPSRIAELTERMLARAAGDRPASAEALITSARQIASTSGENPAAKPQVTVSEPVATAAHDPRYNAESMEACREGRVLFQRSYQGGPGAREKLEYARALFERARDIDAKNPYALVGLADVHHTMGFRGYTDFNTATRLATELRAEALRLDPGLSELHVSIAVDLLYWKDDFATAGAEYRKGMESGRARPDSLRLYGAYLKMAGKLDDALRHVQIGLAGDPQAPALHVGLADVLMAMGRYVEAIEPLHAALRLNASYESALERLDIASSRLGHHEEAADARRALHGLRQRNDLLEALEADIARMGAQAARVEDIKRELDALLARATAEDPFIALNVSRQLADYIIMACAELGEWKKAMDWVERSFYRRPGRLRRLLTDMPFDRRGLATDPRYARMLKMAGLEELL